MAKKPTVEAATQPAWVEILIWSIPTITIAWMFYVHFMLVHDTGGFS
jgi:hypothetical protein